MAKITGMGGNITVSAADYPVSKWSLAVKDDVQDVVDTGSAGWEEYIAGVKSADLTFSAFWGSAVATLSNVFAIGTNVTATLKLGSGGQTASGVFIISDFTITNDAKTPITFECTAKSEGVISVP